MLDFAPQGAWVRSRSGTTLDSLQQIDQLRSLADVENVEPQMLMERRSR
ncbi:MAG: hypothetical protein HC824_05115 [Synechococcales cyanobacterium RM1_1_8]|nr:hypothetical protein [Synechococcales cyanobacterium RM1_1_8]